MARASVCLLLCVSVLLSNGYFYRGTYQEPRRFRYSRPILSSFFRRAAEDECSVCYGNNDCTVFNQARCEFYTATSELLADDEELPENNDAKSFQIRTQVDDMMTTLVEQASAAQVYKECVPYISYYTDCTKETICLGCKTCSCNDDGKWNCTVKDTCRPDDTVLFDHRALVMVMEYLKSDGKPSFRVKRSLQSIESDSGSKLIYERLANWMYGQENNTKNHSKFSKNRDQSTNNVNAVDDDVVTVNDSTGLAKIEPDYLDFEDVLNNIGVIESQSQKKPLNLYNNHGHDYMTLDENDGKSHIKTAVPFFDVLNAVENDDENYETHTQSVPENSTKVVIDLLESARKKLSTEQADHNHLSTTKENTILETPNDIDEFNIINIMKRDVSEMKNIKENITSATTTTSESTSTSNAVNITSTTEVSNDAKALKQLKNNVYFPLDEIIKNKQIELKELTHIREQLVEFLKTIKYDTNSSNINETSLTSNMSRSFFSFYKVEILPLPEKEGDASRTTSGNNLDTYLERLKRDILVVIRDIVVIQKAVGMQNFPPDLKLLIRAMKHYVHYNGKIHQKKKQKVTRIVEEDLRRHWFEPDQTTKNVVKKYLTQILEIMDKDMPQSNALIPLSPKPREIMTRVIKTNRFDDIFSNSLRVNDPNYNLTNDLKIIGTKWQSMTVNILQCSQWDKLYFMKLLHLVLKSDINKMTDALALLDFAHSRRMVPLLDAVNENELRRIDHDLRSMHSKINKLISLRIADKVSNKKVVNVFRVSQSNKKDTFLKHIRDLLKNSKKDIVNLLHKKVPKADIVKELAQKKLDEITKKKLIEYESVMQKWQSNLNIDNRQKRSIFDTIRTRIKNILPKYLRGKVHSGINNSTKNKKSKNGKKHGKRNQRKHGTSNKTSTKTGTKTGPKTGTKTSTSTAATGGIISTSTSTKPTTLVIKSTS